MSRPRAADDFAIIRERMDELRREAQAVSGNTPPATTPKTADSLNRKPVTLDASIAWRPATVGTGNPRIRQVSQRAKKSAPAL